MSQATELSLENCWEIPGVDIPYLRKAFICVEFKNNSNHTLEIREASCKFQTEEGLAQNDYSIRPLVFLRPNHRSEPLEIPFYTDLSLRRGSNFYSIDVDYKRTESGEAVKQSYAPGKYIVIHSLRPPERHFFISHKDPESVTLAQRLASHLTKIGFNGFLAEQEKRPGLDFWSEKIVPAIDTCVAFITLWTEDAARDPSSMLKELYHAKKENKRLILLSEKGLPRPDSFPDVIDFVRTSGAKISETDLLDLVRWTEQTYRTGGYEAY